MTREFHWGWRELQEVIPVYVKLAAWDYVVARRKAEAKAVEPGPPPSKKTRKTIGDLTGMRE